MTKFIDPPQIKGSMSGHASKGSKGGQGFDDGRWTGGGRIAIRSGNDATRGQGRQAIDGLDFASGMRIPGIDIPANTGTHILRLGATGRCRGNIRETTRTGHRSAKGNPTVGRTVRAPGKQWRFFVHCSCNGSSKKILVASNVARGQMWKESVHVDFTIGCY